MASAGGLSLPDLLYGRDAAFGRFIVELVPANTEVPGSPAAVTASTGGAPPAYRRLWQLHRCRPRLDRPLCLFLDDLQGELS